MGNKSESFSARRRKALKLVGGAGVAGAAAAVAAPAISQGRQEWNLQMTWRANSPLLATGPQIVADYITRASEGRLKVNLHAAGDIAPPFQVLDAVVDGALDMGHGYPAYWAGKLNAVQFLTPLPFGMTTQEQNAWFTYGGGQQLADEIYAELGVKFFPSGNTSVQAAGWFNKEVNSLADYRGLKIRSGGLGAKVLGSVGATPAQMPLGEVPQALQTGAIDGADFVGPFNDVAFGLHKVAKYYYWPGWMEPTGVLDCFVNLNTWNSLAPDLQQIIEGANRVANSIVLDEFVAKNAQALEQISNDPNVSVRILDDNTLKGLKSATREVVEDIASKDPLSQKVYGSITKFLAQVGPYTDISERAFMRARTL